MKYFLIKMKLVSFYSICNEENEVKKLFEFSVPQEADSSRMTTSIKNPSAKKEFSGAKIVFLFLAFLITKFYLTTKSQSFFKDGTIVVIKFIKEALAYSNQPIYPISNDKI